MFSKNIVYEKCAIYYLFGTHKWKLFQDINFTYLWDTLCIGVSF